jgi:hypothetical protein
MVWRFKHSFDKGTSACIAAVVKFPFGDSLSLLTTTCVEKSIFWLLHPSLERFSHIGRTPFPSEGSKSLLCILLFTVTSLINCLGLCLFCAKKHICDGRIIHRMSIEFHNCSNVFPATAYSNSLWVYSCLQHRSCKSVAATVRRKLFDARSLNNVVPDLPHAFASGILKHQTVRIAV